MGKPLRVLIVEDSEDDALLLLRELQRGGYEVVSERVETARTMQSALTQQTWDLIISDYTLPEFNAQQALEVLKASDLDLPFILISGTIGEETAVAALKAGASDFLVKGKFVKLGPAIERELREAESRRQRRRAEEALHTSEELFRTAFEYSPMGMCMAALDGRLVNVNQALSDMLGFTKAELEGKQFNDITHPEDLEIGRDAIGRMMSGEVPSVSFEKRYLKKTGEPTWALVSSTLLKDSSGKPLHFITQLLDITERMQAEKQVQLQLKRMRALNMIDRSINSNLDMHVSLDFLLKEVRSQLGVDATTILLLNSFSHNLEYIAGMGFRASSIRQTRARLGDGIAGQVGLEHKVIHISNLTEAGNLFKRADLLKDEEFIEYFGVPLIAKGLLKGVLEIFHRAPLNPDPEWVSYLETLGGQAAIAIDNAQLFEGIQRSNLELITAYDATIAGWSQALDLRDKETEGHSQRVTELTLQLAEKMGLSQQELVQIRRGALLHDIGKLGVPDQILLKPGKLTDEEWDIMRQHPTFAVNMLSPIHYLGPALDIPHCHHEKWDGTGYPRGLKGEQIPLSARLFAIVDVWDALRSDRPYRAGWSLEKTREYILEQSGKYFDPQVVKTFLALIDDEPPSQS